MKFYATLLILTLLLGFCEARRATNGYATSFVFLTARNTDTGDEVQVCANYLQYKFRRIAPDEESAELLDARRTERICEYSDLLPDAPIGRFFVMMGQICGITSKGLVKTPPEQTPLINTVLSMGCRRVNTEA